MSVLDDHTVLRYRSLDRMMLNAYLPMLQTPGAVARFLERLPRTHRYQLTPFGLRVAAVCTKLHDRVLDPAIARSRGSPPTPARTRWRRFEAALDGLLADAHLAA
ncbi:MAG: hypothetical protein HYX56_05915 [Chloroflexi bacterium]|nr:hypothetical protein [Chloroflexota bacterium]